MEFQSRVATFSLITFPSSTKSIQIICNHLVAQIDNSPKKSPKYKKVGKTTKGLLLSMVDSGSSIVSVQHILNLGCCKTWNKLFDSQIHNSNPKQRACKSQSVDPHFHRHQ